MAAGQGRGTAKRASKAPLEEVPEGLAEEVEKAVRAAGALTLRKLTAVKLSRSAEALLHEELARRGLERTGKHVRVPLGEQLRVLLRSEGELAMKLLKKRIVGASTAAELKRVVTALVEDGEAVVVLDGRAEALCRPSGAFCSEAELEALRGLAAALVQLGKAVKARKGQLPKTLRREVVQALVAPFGEAAGAKDAWPALARAIAERAAAGGPLVFVPDLVAACRERHSVESLREALLAAAKDGRVELRPESGVGLLGRAQAALCPTLPDGTPLSYVRRLDS